MFGQGVILHPSFLFSQPINIMTMFSLSMSLTKSRYITLILAKIVSPWFCQTHRIYKHVLWICLNM